MNFLPSGFVYLAAASLILWGTAAQSSLIKCKDDDGRDVDWFIAYKLPKQKNSHDQYAKVGLAYSYIVPNSLNWQKSKNSVNESGSMIGRTLQQLYTSDLNKAYLLYNDQPPGAPTIDTNGHTKGALLANLAGGIWLQFSVPHFPSLEHPQHYSYPHTGLNNGQIFLCFSLTLPVLDSLGKIFKYTKPNIFNHSIPDSFKSVLPTLEQIVPRRRETQLWLTDLSNSIEEKEQFSIEDAVENNNLEFLKTGRFMGELQITPSNTHEIFEIRTAGRVFTVFAKAPSFHQEIYSDWIAPYLQTGLDVQSWLNGPHAYLSNCTSASLSVYNIDNKGISGFNFSTHRDHSKWAVSTTAQKPWICIGDLNRMEHQRVRGGCVICVSDQNIWSAFKNSVVNTQPCGPQIQDQQDITTSQPPKDRLHKRIWQKLKSYWKSLWNRESVREE